MSTRGPANETADRRYGELIERFGAIADIEAAGSLLAWDERTMMPPAGAEGRAEQMATLASIGHERLTDEGLWELVCELSEPGRLVPGSLQADTVRIARREVEKARRVPGELRAELARASSLGESAWAAAREANDFEGFRPRLERNIELRRRYSSCFEPADHPYDPLLDDYEPGLPTAVARELLGHLREGIVPLVERIAGSARELPEGPFRGRFEAPAQARLMRRLLAELPLPEDGWRLEAVSKPPLEGLGAGPSNLRPLT